MAGPPLRRVNGARALALAFVTAAETINRVKNLSAPRYGRLTLPDVNARLGEIHRLCRDWQMEINHPEGVPMPGSKYAPLKNRYWTAEGDNGKDETVNVGIFSAKPDADQWCRRQNETQRQQEWGNGSAGPMTFKPKPLYGSPTGGTGAPDPKHTIYPERQWDPTDAGDL